MEDSTATTLIVFVDGACTHNHAKDKSICRAAYGIFVCDGHPWNEGASLPSDIRATNQSAELYAFRAILKKLLDWKSSPPRKVIVKTDSLYVVKIYTTWARQWERNNWQRKTRHKGLQPVQNLQLIRESYDDLQKLKLLNVWVSLIHVPAHREKPEGGCSNNSNNSNNSTNSEAFQNWYGNMQADRLAREATSNKTPRMGDVIISAVHNHLLQSSPLESKQLNNNQSLDKWFVI